MESNTGEKDDEKRQQRQQQQQQRPQQNQNVTNPNNNTCSNSTNNHDVHDDDDEHIYWMDDHWTVEDRITAQKQLKEYATQCMIDNDSTNKKKKYKRFTKRYTHYLQTHRDHQCHSNDDDDYHAWNQFYISNHNKFFKDRHYLSIDFPNEFEYHLRTDRHRCLIEMGCGVGNTILPLLEIKEQEEMTNHDDGNTHCDNDTSRTWNHRWLFSHIYGFDISPVAIDILRQDVRYQKYDAMKNHNDKKNELSKLSGEESGDVDDDLSTNHSVNDKHAGSYDVVSSPLWNSLPHERQHPIQPQIYVEVCNISIPNGISSQYDHIADVVTLLFCLSSIDPMKHITTILNIIKTLKPPTSRKKKQVIKNNTDFKEEEGNNNDNDDDDNIHTNEDGINDDNHDDDYNDDGGVIIFRDYGRYDEAQMKLSRQHDKLLPLLSSSDNGNDDTKRDMNHNDDGNNHHTLSSSLPCHNQGTQLDDNTTNIDHQSHYSHYYRKHDGTKCYYFTMDDIILLFHTYGRLKVLECQYIYRKYYNRSLNIYRRRIWIQGRFQKMKP